MRSDKMLHITLTLTLSFKKIDGCANNPEKPSITIIDEHITCEFSISTIWVLIIWKNKISVVYIMGKKWCSFLRDHTTNVIDFEKTKVLPLTNQELKVHQDAMASYSCGKGFPKKFDKDKNYRKGRDHCHLVYVI